ncbi:MAG TPA: PKD domain-containing protein, partial [Candidatus Paceibacterota bacterium]|nr:PKD domain-containing protein [Candidatus Paceibacterota bacterium]
DAAQIGVKLNLVIKTYNQLSQDWMKADYDTWLWDWIFSPISDPSTDVLSVLTTMEIGTWQDVYWSNATFDDLYNRSLVAMDPTARRQLTDQMQQISYDSFGCQLVAYRKDLYAAYKGEWGGYGDWAAQYQLMPDWAMPYLYMQISPNGTAATNPNTAPKISSLATLVNADKGVSKAFTGSATDAPGTTLNYQWFWGDSTTPSGWSTSSGANHIYAKDGYYTAYFAVKEANTADGFISVRAITVKVSDPSNTAPHSLGISYAPSSPNTGNMIAFTASADDDQDDPLYYTWNFGDTYTSQEANPHHRYANPGSYSVTLSVTDNHVSPQPRPVSTTVLVSVSANRQPTVSVPAYPYVGWKINTAFTVTANDLDGDALRYTFLWGDGDRTVTSTPSATHAYQQKSSFTLTVYADDLTGIAGHNASGQNTANVVTPVPVQPGISVFSASATTVEVGQAITFTGTASDGNGGVLKLTFQYTGTPNAYDVRTSGSLVAGELYSQTTSHSYASPGTKSVSLYVLDDTGNNVTITPITLTIVVPNQPPIVTPLSPYSGVTGTTITFTGDAYDPDNADLRYTWNFGDGSAMKVGISVGYAYTKPGTWTVTLYVDDLTGLAGHNVSAVTTATIGWRLVLSVGWNLVSLPMT